LPVILRLVASIEPVLIPSGSMIAFIVVPSPRA